MITSEQRKQIERMAYDAVKALTGEQHSLVMVLYEDATIDNEIINGKFRFWNKSVNYFDLEIKNNDITTVMPRERVK